MMDKDIRSMSYQELMDLGDELAVYLSQKSHWDVETVMQNLNVLEVVLALHHYFDMEKDCIIFDQKRQSVIHEKLLGNDDISKLDNMGGALSQALAHAKSGKNKTIVLLNDHAFNRGETYEGLVEIAKENPDLLIVLIHEQESLLRHYTSVDALIKNIRISKTYTSFKTDMKQALDNPVSRPLLGTLTWIRDQVKETVLEPSIFTQFGMNYQGPIDGQNLKEVMKVFDLAKDFKGTHVIHVQTRLKGNKKRHIEFPKYKTDHEKPEGYLTTLEHLDRYLLKNPNDKLIVLSDGVSLSEHLVHFSQAKPKQYYTVSGSSHALVDMAKGFSDEQREVMMLISAKRFSEVAIKVKRYFQDKQNITLIVYEAGLSRYDRSVHAAVYDMASYVSFETDIVMPKDSGDFLNIMNQDDEGFRIIRVPHLLEVYKPSTIKHEGVWQEVRSINSDTKAVILTFGPNVDLIDSKIEINTLNYALIDTQTFNKIDETIMKKISHFNLPIFIYNLEGDFDILSKNIFEYMFKNKMTNAVQVLNLDHVDYNLSSKDLKTRYKLHLDDLFKLIKEA